jgi:hypothetical protein
LKLATPTPHGYDAEIALKKNERAALKKALKQTAGDKPEPAEEEKSGEQPMATKRPSQARINEEAKRIASHPAFRRG